MPKTTLSFIFRLRRDMLTTATLFVGLTAATTGYAIASTQPFARENPFETSIPDSINRSGNVNSIVTGEPAIGDIVPNFPGLPDDAFPTTPGTIVGTVGEVLGGGALGEGAIDILGSAIPGGLPPAVPQIFRDILGGNMGGILNSILGVLTSQNEIFSEVSKVVLGDGWEGIDGDANTDTPPDPYKVRLPQTERAQRTGPLTRSEIVLRRDQANQYDQELGRAMAAPMLAERGDAWLNANITTSSDMMQAGLASTQSVLAKAAEATQATSTQDIVRKSAEMSGIAATLQMQEMQQNALLGESLWNMQRLASAQLQLAADVSEAADEQNRRDRASRSAGLASAAAEAMIIPGLADINRTDTAASAPRATAAAPSLFATP